MEVDDTSKAKPQWMSNDCNSPFESYLHSVNMKIKDIIYQEYQQQHDRKLQHGDCRQWYCTVYLKAAERVDHKSSHHKKKKCVTFICGDRC